MTTTTATTTAAPPRIADRVRDRILKAVTQNRVTIVIGPTGCGKSTQVPKLLATSFHQVVCTQPRRLAVVAVSTRVAQELGVPLGGTDVGYHVGQSNHSLQDTKLLFTTAGILLEELRANGPAALTKLGVLIVDECHERSAESDLVLALIRSFMLRSGNNKIRLVLMSATFDHVRYQDYFQSVSDHIDNISLETADSFDVYHDRVQIHYLDSIVKMLRPEDHIKLHRNMQQQPDVELAGTDGGKSLTEDMVRLILSLVNYLDKNEPAEGGFVIFAPTYRQLEQIYNALMSEKWKVGVLHSAVDMEHCLRTMQQSTSRGTRKVLLASAIAESSVTIPGVTVVIDLCRSLRVQWVPTKKMYLPKTVWASQSICDQRKGRTGRTCPGSVYRLVPQGLYTNILDTYETPQLTLSSCRDEVLKLTCAGKYVPDVQDLLGKCLDPPSPSTMRESMEYLESIGACVERKHKMKATKSGELIAALAFKVEDSHIILTGARMALLHEVLALRAIASHKPLPIVHHFGETDRNEQIMRRFYRDVQVSRPTSINIAHLSAFLFWDRTWNESRAKAAMEQFRQASSHAPAHHPGAYNNDFTNEAWNTVKPCCDVWKWTPELEEKHIIWCDQHDINPTSVRSIADLIQSAWNVFYQAEFEPQWLRCVYPTPKWRRAESLVYGSSMITMSYGEIEGSMVIEALTALCDNPRWAAEYAAEVKGLRPLAREKTPMACVHFLQGNCIYGDKCRNSHTATARRLPCRYFITGVCTRGTKCSFSHNLDDYEAPNIDAIFADAGRDSLSAIAPLLPQLSVDSKKWFRDNHSLLLMLGEGNYDFTRILHQLGMPHAFSSDLENSDSGRGQSFIVDATRINSNRHIELLMEHYALRCFAWNFPFTGHEEDVFGNESLVSGTFQSLSVLLNAHKFKANNGGGFEFAITLQGDQLSRWNVLHSAIRAGWHLSSWGPFVIPEYPGYKPRRANGEMFPPNESRFYVFRYRGPKCD